MRYFNMVVAVFNTKFSIFLKAEKNSIFIFIFPTWRLLFSQPFKHWAKILLKPNSIMSKTRVSWNIYDNSLRWVRYFAKESRVIEVIDFKCNSLVLVRIVRPEHWVFYCLTETENAESIVLAFKHGLSPA